MQNAIRPHLSLIQFLYVSPFHLFLYLSQPDCPNLDYPAAAASKQDYPDSKNVEISFFRSAASRNDDDESSNAAAAVFNAA